MSLVEDIQIRPAGPEDVAGIADVWRETAAYFVASDPDAFRMPATEGLEGWMQSIIPGPEVADERCLVADAGWVVGFVQASVLRPSSDAAFQLLRDATRTRVVVGALGVIAAFRGRGTGAALMRAVESWGRAHGAELVVLDANWKTGVGVSFYEERLGYERHSLGLRKVL